MEILTLHSISPLETKDVFNTSTRPVRVLCNDLTYQVAKYKRGRGDHSLLREYLGALFLQHWNLAIPTPAFIKIPSDHVLGLHADIQPHYFDSTCFGLKYERHYDEVSKIMESMSNYQRSLYINKNEFLSIALFDLWVANEDRNANNYNLLVDVRNNFRFVPIDHGSIFNWGEPKENLTLLTETDSIISSPLFQKLFSRKETLEYGRNEKMKDKYYLCIEKCEQNLDDILQMLAQDWNIDVIRLKDTLQKSLFQKEWLEQVWNTFISYLQLSLNHK